MENKIIIYRNQQEAAMDQFIVDNPEVLVNSGMRNYFFWFGSRLVGVAKGESAEEARGKVLQEVKMGINWNPEDEISTATAKTY